MAEVAETRADIDPAPRSRIQRVQDLAWGAVCITLRVVILGALIIAVAIYASTAGRASGFRLDESNEQ